MDFEIEVDSLLDFLEKIKSDEYIIQADNTGLRVSSMDATQVLYQNVLLDRSAFQKYPQVEKELEIPIEKHQKFVKLVKRFKSKVQLLVGDKYLVLSGPGSEAYMVLASKGIISIAPAPKKVAFDTFMKLKADFFQEVIGDYDLLEANVFDLQVKGGELTVTTTDNVNRCIRKEKVEHPDGSSKYGEYLKEIFNSLSGDVNVAFKTDFPVMVKHNSKFVKTVYILAPFVEPVETEKK